MSMGERGDRVLRLVMLMAERGNRVLRMVMLLGGGEEWRKLGFNPTIL
jgi:hypothetical protein